MTTIDLEKLKYPMGKFEKPEVITPQQINAWILEIKELPELLHRELKYLSKTDYLRTYRPDGWNITQLVHHLADSHMNSFIRFKLALTESNPVVKPYLEDKWSVMADNTTLDAGVSLSLLESLHVRWVYLLRHMTEADFKQGYIHPQKNRKVDLDETIALYAWHSRHHLAHIRIAKNTI